MNDRLASKIAPSLMCAGPFELEGMLETFAQQGIEYLHMDVMDGQFVPNFALGVDFIKKLREQTKIPMDIHLMTEKPEAKIEWFEPAPGEYVSVHAESTAHLQRALQKIKSFGAKPMVALNPATPLCALEYILEDIDGVLLMTVNPGFAGQRVIPQTLEKIEALRKRLDDRGYPEIEIEVDGNVSLENAPLMKRAGANIFVAGTSGLFIPGMPLEDGIHLFGDLIGRKKAAVAD